MDSKNLAIGVLSTTAVILLVGLLVIHTRPVPALADGMTVTGGDYLLTVGSVTKGDEELLFVLDAPLEKLITYRFDVNRKEIQVVQGIDLAELRRTTSPSSQPTGGRKRSRGRGP